MYQSTRMRILFGSIWGLAGYCTYSVIVICRLLLSHPERMPYLGVAFWVPGVLTLVGMFLYTTVALRTPKNIMIPKAVQWFQLFSGLFAGIGTTLIWIWLFAEVTERGFTYNFYQWLLLRSLVSATAVLVAITITRSYSHERSYRYLIISFVTATLFCALLQLGEKFGIDHIDPQLLLAGAGFTVFAYFFPNAASLLVNIITVIFAVVFSIVGSIFNKRN